MSITKSIGKGIGEGMIEKIGRGYIMGIIVLIAFVILIALNKDTSQFLEFVTWFVLPLIGVKEAGKVGQSIANRNKKQPLDTNNN